MGRIVSVFGFTVILLSLISGTLKAEIILPAIFGNHMVLQQQTDAAIWGKTSTGTSVQVQTSWNKKQYTTKADSDGNWKIKVNTPKAGGPFEITISDGESITLRDVLIGEVWVCSGQSNMQMTMKGYYNEPVLGSNLAVAKSENTSIRLFTVERNKSLTLLDEFKGDWLTCEPKNVADFSAVAYYYGKILQETLGVPIGLISSSWGGTPIESWMSEIELGAFDWVKLPDKKLEGDFSPQLPTVLYNAMIAPMVTYAIQGVIWYQGESNHNAPAAYEKLMPGMVNSWRKVWGIGDFPFYYVQIAPYEYNENDINSAYLREAQLKVSTTIPHVGMACVMDLGEKNCIHPANKEIVGQRLALLALAKTYGKNGIACSGPVLKDMTIEGNKVYLTFDHAENGLNTFGKKLENFEVAGEDQKFFPASSFISENGVTVYSEMVQKPIAVRYAFDDFVVGSLFNTEGLPASSFRTDIFPIE